MKFKVTGNFLAATSTIKKADIDLLAKYDPKALNVTDEDGNDLFSVKNGNTGSICAFGITFNTASVENGNAMITIAIPAELKTADAVKEWVADISGAAQKYIEALETSIPGKVEEIKGTRAAIMDSVELA